MIPRIDSGSGGGTDTTDDSTDSDTSTSDGSSSNDYEYTYDNRYDADPTQSESGQAGAGAPAVDLTSPDPNENEDGDGVFVDDDGNTIYDPSQEPSPPQDDTEDIVDRVADDDVVVGEDGMIANPADDPQNEQGVHTVRVEAAESLPTSEYTLSVAGSISKGDLAEPDTSTVEAGRDTINGQQVTGNVGNGAADSYTFTGELESFSVPSGIDVFVDGERVSASGALLASGLPGGTVELPGIGEVPVAVLALAVVAAGVSMGG